ncbi:MAG: PIG-L family deacetylase, partial [Burkholderiales bacterium]
MIVVSLACLVGVGASGGAQAPLQDSGAAGAWQKLLKLSTTASVMHTTAHPDDEHGGMLAMLSRGQGARVSLLTLTRGESGDNAIGPELFDGLALVRTEELLVADRYYGVDHQYFATVVDYGFSKRLDEALEKWGKDYVLRDVVGVIRTERPFVIIARFQGNERDGHGNHSASGLVTREAFRLAGDPNAFPEQVAAGLRPWQPLKLYMGGVRENEDWTIRVDAGEYDPVLGDSYQSIARRGLGFQRSQNGGRAGSQPGPSLSFYKRLDARVEAPAREKTFFDGIDTTLEGLYRALRKPPPPGVEDALAGIDRQIRAAVAGFRFDDPSASAPALALAL